MDETEREKKFWKNVKKTRKGCWTWTGFINRAAKGKNSGRYIYEGVESVAHRYSYELVYGSVDRNLCVNQTCNNDLCVNPEHLQVITKSEAYALARATRATCRNGHPQTEENLVPRTWKGRTYYKCDLCIKEAAARKRELFRSQERKPMPDKETLAGLLKTHTLTSIALQYGVTDHGVRYWAKKYDLL